MSRRPDVVALVLGVLFTVLAAGLLVDTLVVGVTWAVVKVVAPLVLVAVGVAGLALSRNRS
jgi:hypothetical protein